MTRILYSLLPRFIQRLIYLLTGFFIVRTHTLRGSKYTWQRRFPSL